jgi:hypothetical protein
MMACACRGIKRTWSLGWDRGLVPFGFGFGVAAQSLIWSGLAPQLGLGGVALYFISSPCNRTHVYSCQKKNYFKKFIKKKMSVKILDVHQQFSWGGFCGRNL